VELKVASAMDQNLNYEAMLDIQKKIQIDPNSIDKPLKFNGKENVPTVKEEKKEFIDNYSTQIKIPTGYVNDMKIYIKDPKFYLQLIHMMIPDDFAKRT